MFGSMACTLTHADRLFPQGSVAGFRDDKPEIAVKAPRKADGAPPDVPDDADQSGIEIALRKVLTANNET
jgi:hypothetical protein